MKQHTPICIYHKSDFDGVCSAAIVRKFVPDVVLYPIDHGDVFPWDEIAKDRKVYLVDFSLNAADDMKRLAKECDLVWIDHHKSAIDLVASLKLKTSIPGFRETEKAACELCWAWFSGGQDLPQPVWLLGRYDVWDKTNVSWEDILDFQYGLRATEDIYDPANWRWADMLNPRFGESGITTLRLVGLGVRSYLRQNLAAQAARGAFPAEVAGCKAICLNTAELGSSPFDSVWDPEKYDLMVSFFQRADGKWRHGFYSTKPGVDCSEIAKAFGGGGHRGAAGCILDKPGAIP